MPRKITSGLSQPMTSRLSYSATGVFDAVNDNSFLTALPSGFTYTRAGAGATYRDSNGDWQSASANEELIDHQSDGTPRGLRVEPTAQNKANHDNMSPSASVGGVAVISGDGAASVVADANISTATIDGSTFSDLQNGNVIELTGGTTGTTYRVSLDAGSTNNHSYRILTAPQGTGYHGNVKLNNGVGLNNYGTTSGAWEEIIEEDFVVDAAGRYLAVYVAPSKSVRIAATQFEEGAHVTSPIVTTGVSGITRNAPTIRNTSPSNILPQSGCVMIEYEDQYPRVAPTLQTLFQYGETDTDDQIAIYKNTNGDLLFRYTSGGTEYLNYTFDSDAIVAGVQKIALSWGPDTSFIAINGVEVLALTSATPPLSASNGITVGMFSTLTYVFDGWIRNVKLYPKYPGRETLESDTNITIAVSGGTYDASRNMVMMLGQSNSVGIGADADPTLTNTVYLLGNDGALKTFVEPYDDVTNQQFGSAVLSDASAGNGYAGTIIDDLTDSEGGVWCAVPANKGGMGTDYSYDPTHGCYIYDDIGSNRLAMGVNAYGMIQRIKQAASLGTIRAFVWNIAATDAINGISDADFTANHQKIIERLRSYVDYDIPVVKIVIHDKPSWMDGTYPSNRWDEIQALIPTYTLENSTYVASEGNTLQVDELHFTTAGYVTLGADIATAIGAIL